MISKKKILVIEDDTSISELLKEIIADVGYSVQLAFNGAEAMEVLCSENERTDLILLDLMMPIMDGQQFRVAQVADSKLMEIPVMIMSASGNVEKLAQEMNVKDYIKKPIQIDSLLEKIESCLKNAPSLTPEIQPPAR